MTRLSAETIRSETAVRRGADIALSLDVREASDREFALNEWRSLEAQQNAVPLTCSADWTEAWIDAYGDLVSHWFVLAKEATSGRTAGVCLVTRGVGQKDGPLPVRSLHLGTAGEPEADSVCVEYNDVLVEPNAHPEFCRLLGLYFKEHRGIDQWNIDGADEQLVAEFDAEAEPPLTRRTEVAHWFDLTVPRGNGTRVLDELRSSTRRKVKRSLEAYGELSVDWSQSLNEATDIFGDLVDLHQARWNAVGKPGSYASERFIRFHEALLVRLVPEQRMFFVRVRSGVETVGCVQLFNDRNRALLYQCGWAPAEGKRSPGVVVDYLAMEECLSRGFDAYDFLAYETQHKRHLSNRCSNLIWAYRRRPRLRFSLLNAARNLKHHLKTRNSGQQP